MFDDDNIKDTGTVPTNLPMGEPDDIFSGTDSTDLPSADPVSTQNTQSVHTPQTALGAGVLKPKNVPESKPVSDIPAESPVSPTIPDISSTTQQTPQMPIAPARPDVVSQLPPEQRPPTQQGTSHMTTPPVDMHNTQHHTHNDITEPIGNRRAIMWIILIVVFIVLGLGSVWIYFSVIRPDTEQDFFVADDTAMVDDFEVIPVQEVPVETVVETSDGQTTTNTQDTEHVYDINEKILLGEPLDTDGDGLDDVREAAIHTDPLNWDTDNDELGDGDEVTIWKTDPLNADTDGDTYLDGVEIRNGYNPTGEGKLFEPPSPTTTEQQAI